MYENGDGQLHLSISTPWVDIRRPVQATHLKGTLYILEAQTIRKRMCWWVTLADLILRNGSFLHSSSFLFQPRVLVCLWLLKHVGTSILHLTSTLVSSVNQVCLTLCDPMNCNTPAFPVHHQLQLQQPTRSLLKLMSIESVMPSNHLILCHPLLLPP